MSYLPLSAIALGPVTATGSTTARDLADRFSDIINVKDYGAKLDGVTNDTAAFQAAYDAAPSGGTVFVPADAHLSEYGITTSAGKNILWQTLGAFDYGASASGTNPVFVTLTDGDVLAGYYGGRYNFTKSLTNSTNGYAVVAISLDNNIQTTQNGDVASSLAVSSTSHSTTASGSYTWTINANLFTGAMNGDNNQDVSVASSVWKTGAATTWQYFGQSTDQTGLPPAGNGSLVAFESDLSANGPEVAETGYNFAVGSRTWFELDGSTYTPPTWTASKSYAVGDVVTAATSPGNANTYICTVAGTSGTTEPTWPTSTGTVTDGTATWKYGTTIAMEVSRAIAIHPGTNGAIGTGVVCNGTFYNVGFDTSFATFVSRHSSSPAAFRMAADQVIDFTGNQTLAGQNLHTLKYSSGNSRLEYGVAGSAVAWITDQGALEATGGLIAGPSGLTLNIPALELGGLAINSGAPVSIATSAASSNSTVMTFASTTGVGTSNTYAVSSAWGGRIPVTAVTATTVTLTAPVTISAGVSVFFVVVSRLTSNYVNNGNGAATEEFEWRSSSGTNWTGSSRRLQYAIDADPMGFIEYNPVGYTYGLALGSGSISLSPTYALVVDSSNNLHLGTGAISTGASYFSFGGPNAEILRLNDFGSGVTCRLDASYTSATNTVNLHVGNAGANLSLAGLSGGALVADSDLTLHYALNLTSATVTSGASFTVGDVVAVIIDKTTGSATAVTLPSSPPVGRYVVIKDGKGDAATNNITITPASGTIDGAANVVLNSNYEAMTLIYNGTEWNLV